METHKIAKVAAGGVIAAILFTVMTMRGFSPAVSIAVSGVVSPFAVGVAAGAIEAAGDEAAGDLP